MSELLHATALVPATVGVCCTIGDRRRAVEVAAGVLMVLAMADLALGRGLVPAWLWAVSMLSLAVPLAVVRSRHAAAGMVLMGLLAALQAHHQHVAGMAGGAAGVHALGHGLASTALPVWILLGTGWYVVHEERRIRHARPTLGRTAIWESRLMSSALGLMVAAHLLGSAHGA